MGNTLTSLNSTHDNVKHVNPRQNINNISIDKVFLLCTRWKALGIPFIMTVNEFQKALVQSEDIHLNFENFKSSNEIEVLSFLTQLIVLSTGPLDKKLQCKIPIRLIRFL